MALFRCGAGSALDFTALTEKIAINSTTGTKSITGVNVGDLVIILTQETTAPTLTDMQLLTSGSISYGATFQINTGCVAIVTGNNPSYEAVKTGTSTGWNQAFSLTVA